MNKGREFEKVVRDMIKSKGLDDRARRTGASGAGLDKNDISTNMQVLGRNVGIECKNQKVMNFQTWWRQVEKACLGYSEPVLVFKFDKEPMEAAKCVIYFETFLDLVKKAQEPKMAEHMASREERYKVQRLVEAAKAVVKLYEF